MAPRTKEQPHIDAAFLSESGPNASDPVSGTATVFVFCKHWPGLILRVGKMIPTSEPSPTGLREIPGGVFQETGRFQVFGPARAVGADARAPVADGYAVTHGVPKDLWDAWYAENKDSDIVRNQLLFAEEDANRGYARARNLRELKTGMEPLSQGKDSRVAVLQRPNATMTGIEPFSKAE